MFPVNVLAELGVKVKVAVVPEVIVTTPGRMDENALNAKVPDPTAPAVVCVVVKGKLNVNTALVKGVDGVICASSMFT